MATRPEPPFYHGFEFDFMARRPLYAVCPRWILEHCAIGPTSRVADIGCGSGIFTQSVLDRFPEAPGLRVFAIDPSEFELSIMRSRITDRRVTCIEGRAQDASATISNVDVAVLCNVLHQIPIEERRPVLEGVFDLLQPGGAVGLNTLFYEGAIPGGTAKFYSVWLMNARRFLKKAGITLEPPAARPVALQRLSAGQHGDLLAAIGFEHIEVEEVECSWAAEDWEALSHYSVFIQGALQPDIDLHIGRQALVEGVRSAYRDLGIGTIERRWLHLSARRP